MPIDLYLVKQLVTEGDVNIGEQSLRRSRSDYRDIRSAWGD